MHIGNHSKIQTSARMSDQLATAHLSQANEQYNDRNVLDRNRLNTIWGIDFKFLERTKLITANGI